MDSKSLLFGLLFATVFTCQITPGQSVDTLLTEISKKLVGLFQHGHLEFLGYPCQYELQPKVRKFELKYEGKIWCPGWTPVTGRALKSSRSGTVKHAMRDFLTKAIAAGFVEKADADVWLAGYK